MKASQRRHILENAARQSPAELAAALGLPENKVQEVLTKNGQRASKQFPLDKTPGLAGQTILLSAAAILLLCFAIYSSALKGQFVWDDDHFIADNAFVKDWSHLGEIFTTDLKKGAGMVSFAYRPVQMLTYVADYALWGKNPVGYHVTNILLHSFAAMALFWLLFLLFRSHSLALGTALLFAVHPVHTEAVAYISGRADMLMFLFACLSLIFYTQYQTKPSSRKLALAMVFYALSLFSKEYSLVLPFLLLLVQISFKVPIRLQSFLGMVLVIPAYMMMHSQALEGINPHAGFAMPLAQRIPTALAAFAQYIGLLAFPAHLHMEYGMRHFALTDAVSLAGLILLVFFFVLLMRSWKTNRFFFACLAGFLVALFPVSNILPLNAYMAEHWLYVPSIAIFLLVVKTLITLKERWKNPKAAAFIFFLCLAVLSVVTWKQNFYWKDPIAFYTRTLQYAPNSERVHYNLANEYMERNDLTNAVRSFQNAIRLEPKNVDALNNLGIAFRRQGKYREAVEIYKQVIEIKPQYALAYNNLGNAFREMGNSNAAIPAYQEAIRLNPKGAEAWNNLAILYEDSGERKEAVSLLRKAVAVNPQYGQAWNNLGILLLKDGVLDEAAVCAEKAARLGVENKNLRKAIQGNK